VKFISLLFESIKIEILLDKIDGCKSHSFKENNAISMARRLKVG
jgi:hypothetical protein